MVKQVVAIIGLSVLVIVGMPYVQHGLQFILSAHNWVSDTLSEVFSGGQAGNVVRELLTLLAVPVALGLLPVIVYWLARRHWFPYFMELVWVIWLIQTAALVILYQAS